MMTFMELLIKGLVFRHLLQALGYLVVEFHDLKHHVRDDHQQLSVPWLVYQG